MSKIFLNIYKYYLKKGTTIELNNFFWQQALYLTVIYLLLLGFEQHFLQAKLLGCTLLAVLIAQYSINV